MEKRTPDTKFKAGTISASVWTNKSKQGRDFKSVSFEKSYTDEKGEWHATNSLNVSDLPKAIVVLSKAYEHLALKGKEAIGEA